MTQIELVGNALCLDFANTVNARPVARRDYLAAATDFIQWAAAVGHRSSADEVEPLLPRLRELREAIYRVFAAIARGDSPASPDLRIVTTACAEAYAAGSLSRADPAYDWSWERADPRVIVWRVAISAVDLLRHGPLDRVGECPSCGWLFLDTSKNGSRRWCSMATCGSRDKARRYYSRHQGAR